MKITIAQYPGLVQNIETLSQVDLSDTDMAMLVRLEWLLRNALGNVARTIADQSAESDAARYEQAHGEPPF